MLEDESGRICLVGARLNNVGLVTGVIMGALGIETHNGDFEVVDICFPGMAPQPSARLPWPTPKKSDETMDIDGECRLAVTCLSSISLTVLQGSPHQQVQMSGSHLCQVSKSAQPTQLRAKFNCWLSTSQAKPVA